ncbi:MAG: hypothetical protein AAGD32_03795 [Planctomycetota bacterium]
MLPNIEDALFNQGETVTILKPTLPPPDVRNTFFFDDGPSGTIALLKFLDEQSVDANMNGEIEVDEFDDYNINIFAFS